MINDVNIFPAGGPYPLTHPLQHRARAIHRDQLAAFTDRLANCRKIPAGSASDLDHGFSGLQFKVAKDLVASEQKHTMRGVVDRRLHVVVLRHQRAVRCVGVVEID